LTDDDKCRVDNTETSIVHDGSSGFLLTSSGATLKFWTLNSTLPALSILFPRTTITAGEITLSPRAIDHARGADDRGVVGGQDGGQDGGQRAVPRRAQTEGFAFAYPAIEESLRHALRR